MAEMFTDADTFSMEFPPDLPVEQKARLLASLLLLDYMSVLHNCLRDYRSEMTL